MNGCALTRNHTHSDLASEIDACMLLQALRNLCWDRHLRRTAFAAD
jgi:hypothetical protein